MSIQTEITRIQSARNTLRAKAVALGIGLGTDNLTQLATKYDAVTDNGTPDAEVKEGETYTISPGYYHGGSVKGVSGGGNYKLQAKVVTPTKQEQAIAPDSGYYGLSGVTVNPIPDAFQDVSDVTATAVDVLSPAVFVNNKGVSVAGTMQNRGAVNVTLDTETTEYTVPAGYHNGAGKVAVSVETKTATPSESQQIISPSAGKVLSKVTVNRIPVRYGDAFDTDAVAANILYGKTAIGYDMTNEKAVVLTGTMVNNKSEAITLGAGDTYTIPQGYHVGTGKVTAKTLASQTGVDTGKTAAGAAQILTGYQAWVNGNKVTGSMADNGAISGTITGLGTVEGDTEYTIPAGYTSGGKVSLTNDIETQLAAI